MKIRVTTAGGRKVVHDNVDLIEISKINGTLTLYGSTPEALRKGGIVESYDHNDWRGIERFEGRAISPCNCGTH